MARREATWFDRLVWDRASRPAEEQRAIVDVPWSHGSALASAPPTEDAALRLEPVFAAWRILASNVAALPLQVYRKTGDKREPLDLMPRLFREPSSQGTPYDWIFRCVVSLCSQGNAVGLVLERDQQLAYPTMIEWLDARRIRLEGTYARPVWKLDAETLPPGDVIHIPWFPMPGRLWGLSPLGAYAATVASGTASREYIRDWYRAGGVPSGTFKNATQTLTNTDASEIKARLVSAIQAHQPIVYGKDWDYNPISVAPHEARFIEATQMDATKIASVYGVPPADIGGHTGDSLTYSTVELEQIKLNAVTLRPWVTKLEQAFFRMLPGQQYVKFNMNATVRADLMTRYQAYSVGLRNGFLKVNEVRAWEDLEPVPGGDEIKGDPDFTQSTDSQTSSEPADGEPADPEAQNTPRLRPVRGAGG